jgi:hypothetical protein
VGASGAYGILLSASEDPAILAISRKLAGAVADSDPEVDDEEEDIPKVVELAEELRVVLREAKVVIPDGASLMWTGSEDDRPGRCDTPAEDWVFGWGLFTDPATYPKIDPSFAKLAFFHTWVWMG